MDVPATKDIIHLALETLRRHAPHGPLQAQGARVLMFCVRKLGRPRAYPEATVAAARWMVEVVHAHPHMLDQVAREAALVLRSSTACHLRMVRALEALRRILPCHGLPARPLRIHANAPNERPMTVLVPSER